MLRSSPCDHSDEYLVVKGTIAITGAGADAGVRQADGRNDLKPATSNPMFFFYCLVCLTEWVIMPRLMCYFT